ncbi:MAG TPA: hypothetical protein VFF64_13190 [Candidatus Eremiobacteraceae bacterium]|nr:hypothetical protein [Candidatus Eremiobacteraceae bacterium]
MTLEELENTLPNGLHDAEVRRMAVDYEKRKVTLEVAVWVGNMDDPPGRREAYKSGRIEISGLLFLVMEPPDPEYPFKTSDLTIDGCDMSKNLDSELLQSLPADSFFRSLWVNEWNAFIHLAAKSADVVWLDDGAITYRASQELRTKS